MTTSMKWEFFPITFYTTKFWYNFNENDWFKTQIVPIIEKDINKNNSRLINENWDCNVSTNFHLDCNILNEYKDLYTYVIKDFLYAIEVNEKSFNGYTIDKIWYNTYEKNTYQERHDHFPHHFSMIHYVEFDSKEHFGTKFFNPHLLSTQFLPEQISNRMVQQVKEFDDIEEGDIIFFPSFVQHLVKPNKSNKRRITVSLNLNLHF